MLIVGTYYNFYSLIVCKCACMGIIIIVPLLLTSTFIMKHIKDMTNFMGSKAAQTPYSCTSILHQGTRRATPTHSSNCSIPYDICIQINATTQRKMKFQKDSNFITNVINIALSNCSGAFFRWLRKLFNKVSGFDTTVIKSC